MGHDKVRTEDLLSGSKGQPESTVLLLTQMFEDTGKGKFVSLSYSTEISDRRVEVKNSDCKDFHEV